MSEDDEKSGRVSELLARFPNVSTAELIALEERIFKRQLSSMTKEMLLQQLIDQVGFDSAVDLLSDLSQQHERPASIFQPVPVDRLIEHQQQFPIYLTNGSCENAHGSVELLRRLNLTFGQWDPNDGSIKNAHKGTEDDVFYPLTQREAQYVAEDGVLIGRYFAHLGYSVLYCGRKYLFPSIEITYASDTKPVNEPADFPSQQEALKETQGLADQLKVILERVRGFVWIFEAENNDRHTLGIAIPFDFAARLGDNYNAVKQWLEKLIPKP